MSRRATRFARMLVAVMAVHGSVLALLLYTPATEWMAWPLYDVYPPVPRSDAIVVLEAWAFDDGELNESGLKRSLREAELYKQAVATTIVNTGEATTSHRPGSALRPMARVVESNGIPSAAVMIDGSSPDTHQSAINVAELARVRGWTCVALVTDASHMRRAAGAFRKAGLTVAPSPIRVWELGAAQPSMRFERLAVLAHEYAGLLWYWWKGWI